MTSSADSSANPSAPPLALGSTDSPNPISATADPASVSPKKLKSLSGLLPFLKPYRLQLLLALVFLLLSAGATLLLPAALKDLIDKGFSVQDVVARQAALKTQFLLMFAVVIALGVFTAMRFYIVSWLGERVTADVRNAVYSHVLRQSPQFFETTQTGEVLSRLTTDTTLVQTVVGSSLSMGLRNTVLFLGAMGMLVVTNPVVMGTVLGILVIIVLPSAYFGRRVRKLSRASQDRVADSSAIAAEVLNAVPVVQGYVQEDREAGRFSQATEAAFQTAIKRNRSRSTLTAFIIIAMFGTLLWGVYQGTQAVLNGTITAGHLGQTVFYVGLVAGSVGVLAEVFGDLLRAAGATERLMELLASQSPIQQPLNAQPIPAAAAVKSSSDNLQVKNAVVAYSKGNTATEIVAKKGQSTGSSISFDDVQFYYPSRPGQAALAGVSFSVAPGETVALVGPSGAGKSTIIALLLRFYDASSGAISINGVPLLQADIASLRGSIALVPQESTLFSANALENIRYGRPSATEAEVVAAAKAAYADDFIRALPDGYNTFLGERGVRLSGGQKQRIAIARAMLKNAPLLLLDEATSALDAESERAVQQALESAMQDRTTLVIAHRLATVQAADRILVLDGGQIVEQGKHAELVAKGGLYARLAELQFTA